jgi:hypothetical protein
MDGLDASRTDRLAPPQTNPANGMATVATSPVRLRSVGASCAPGLALQSPLLMELAAEDVCWWVAIRYWRANRPPVWCASGRLRWRAEGRRLREWRRRLVTYAEESRLTIR